MPLRPGLNPSNMEDTMRMDITRKTAVPALIGLVIATVGMKGAAVSRGVLAAG
jgi:hypothetical protein